MAYCIKLTVPGALIVADCALTGGSVADDYAAPKRHTESMKKFDQAVAAHPQLESLLMPIGDGMTVSRVKKEYCCNLVKEQITVLKLYFKGRPNYNHIGGGFHC